MKVKITPGLIIKFIVLSVLSIIFIIPFIYMISISLASPRTNYMSAFTIIPREFHIQNYLDMFKNSALIYWVKNSIILTIVNLIFTLASCSLVAYAFARLRARGKNIIFMVLLSTMMIPTQVTLIPQFVIFRKLGWINTMLPLIIPNLFGSPFYIFLLRQFIMRLPNSLDEAAKIDGLGYFGIYRKIILPLIKPGLASVAVLTVIANWGWFFEPKIYLNKTEKYPLAVGVQILSTTGNVGEAQMWNIAFAAAMLLVIPMIILYFAGQKYMFEISINAGSDAIK
ncbi:carbohydrate ABC transporter permease [Eisenbergiella sp.]